jgi:acetyl esterase/lipase
MSKILQRVAPIGEARDRELLRDAATYIYQERPQGAVHAHVFFPPQPATAPRPILVFFHGGFWETSTPTQFVPHCLHFASRGAVAVVAETRTLQSHGTGAVEAIEDARDLIRWLRHNHDTFVIDPDKLVAGGAAGGAMAALLTALPKPKLLTSADGISCQPQALLLFSALINPTAQVQAVTRFPKHKVENKWNPLRLIRRKLPPMIFFHGKSDRLTPFADVEKFRRKARFWGNRCDLVDFEKADHSFFNFNFDARQFEHTIEAADHFLTDCGILAENPDTII